MKVLIITQPLLNNYGCFMQNYALQQVLKKNNHMPVTYDFVYPRSPIWIYILSWMKTILYFFIPGKKRTFAKFKQKTKRKPLWDAFVKEYLDVTKRMDYYSKSFIKRNNFDAIIVGSDQVWRPRYNWFFEDMFLRFAKDVPVKKIAYAASFGTDVWEYTQDQTNLCSGLIKDFDAVSVRENFGVSFCRKYLNVNASWVLDPTLLLEKKDYMKLCEKVPVANSAYLAAYVLDMDDPIRIKCETIAKEKKLVLRIFEAEQKATLTIPEWLAMFRDASYVVTDSFHGTVFSIIFGKEFKCIYNETRGAARFESLLNLYNSGKLEEMRQFSLNWLKNALES